MRFIDEHRDRFGVEPICRVLEVSDKTYHARKRRPPSRRQVDDERLLGEIRRVHKNSGGTYGSRRCWKQLAREGIRVGRCRVERLMAAKGIRGAQHGRERFLTRADEHAERPADLVKRRFVASRPNQLWVCDLTCLKTHEGWLYLAFVLDVYGRMIVGWQTAGHMRTDLVLDALEMALHLREPAAGELTHHSDRGSQYTAFRYTQRLADHGIARSIGTVADAYDNAMAESWVGTYKLELPGRPFKSRFDAELATVAYIGWYNHERLHSSLGDIPPVEYEALHLGSGVDEPQLQAVPAQAAQQTSRGKRLTAGL
jgi:putative transposase